jgi:hypothetical protein
VKDIESIVFEVNNHILRKKTKISKGKIINLRIQKDHFSENETEMKVIVKFSSKETRESKFNLSKMIYGVENSLTLSYSGGDLIMNVKKK